MTRTSDRASCTVTRVRAINSPNLEVVVRLALPMLEMIGCRLNRHAGTNPLTSAAVAVATSVRSSNRQSVLTSTAIGIHDNEINDARTGADHRASARPTSPPNAASTPASVTSWRTMRIRLAPKAARVANSASRDALRSSTSPATLAAAISSTSATSTWMSRSGASNSRCRASSP